MKELPDTVTAYKRTPEFTQDTVPAGLLRRHQTKAGTWGRIVILEGRLLYRILEPEIEEVALHPDCDGVVEPEVAHDVAPHGQVRFFVEFYR